MYDLVDTGTLSAANDLLNNVWDVPRYAPVTLPTPLTWSEDPYQQTYWRFLFYSLRPTSNLLWAYYTTRQSEYLTKLLSILQSFTAYDAANPPLNPNTLDNPHAAAFRTMILVDDYVKLTRSGVLPGSLAAALRASIAKLGDFLAQPRNYQGTYNHGFTEGAALLLIAVNFPELAPAAQWRQLALTRLSTLMKTTVGADGVEIERSPFYHFYVFDFALQLQAWSVRAGVALPTVFNTSVATMVRYSTDIIWPDGQIPLIGSSVQLEPGGDSSLYGALEKAYPQFAFALTGGKTGTPPDDRATLFPTSGQIVMRSPISTQEPYSNNSQLVLNGGPPSTQHSHLDALAFTYYSVARCCCPTPGWTPTAPDRCSASSTAHRRTTRSSLTVRARAAVPWSRDSSDPERTGSTPQRRRRSIRA